VTHNITQVKKLPSSSEVSETSAIDIGRKLRGN
jgi:hypothetical protein